MKSSCTGLPRDFIMLTPVYRHGSFGNRRHRCCHSSYIDLPKHVVVYRILLDTLHHPSYSFEMLNLLWQLG